MEINLAFCDDEDSQIENLRALVDEWSRSGGHAVRADSFPSAEAFLFAFEEDKGYHILLLDVEMGGMDGVTLAKRVRAADKEVQIIFVTGYMEYMADGYEVEALHYLLKPVTGEKLAAVLDRAVVKLAQNERALFITHAGENIRVPLYEVRFVEVQKNYVTVHAGGVYKVKQTLGELEKELDERFFRVGRSYIINLRYISRITRTDAYLADGTAIPLPRGMYDALNQAVIARL